MSGIYRGGVITSREGLASGLAPSPVLQVVRPHVLVVAAPAVPLPTYLRLVGVPPRSAPSTPHIQPGPAPVLRVIHRIQVPRVPARPVRTDDPARTTRGPGMTGVIHIATVREWTPALPEHDPVHVVLPARLGSDPGVPRTVPSPRPRPAGIPVGDVDAAGRHPVEDPLQHRLTAQMAARADPQRQPVLWQQDGRLQ
jgi:hypothetical protein